jgi:hypothetical protein
MVVVDLGIQVNSALSVTVVDVVQVFVLRVIGIRQVASTLCPFLEFVVELFVSGVQLCLEVFYLELEVLNLFVHCAVLILGFTPFIGGVSGCVVCLGLFHDFSRCLDLAFPFFGAFGYRQLSGHASSHSAQLFPFLPGFGISSLAVETCHVAFLSAFEAEFAFAVLVYLLLRD